MQLTTLSACVFPFYWMWCFYSFMLSIFQMSVGVLKSCVFYVFSGGYNIKTGPGCFIELMKFDMGGSAAVLGAAKAIGQVKPPGVEVSLPCCPCSHSHC